VSAALSRLDRPVAVVTGGGGGIGGAIAEELGRAGHFVVTVDPLVTLDGAEQMPRPQETTAGRIVAAGGAARASSVSVADRDGVRELFAQLTDEFGRVDAVVNVAGITRPSTFARGTAEDWRSVLDVHLGGYLNILEAALPIMVDAGRGTILGVTSGAGWRAADAGAYSCAKRAVAALTWQLGRVAPPGVVVNAMSPIAATRMVAAALERARGRGPSAASGGLSLDSMPSPEELGPIGAHLVTWDPPTCRGQVIFVGGSEVAVIDRPRLLEVFRTEAVSSISHLLETATSVFAQAEADQISSGGSNPRFATLFDSAGAAPAPGPVGRRCAVVSDRPEMVGALRASLGQHGWVCEAVWADGVDDPGAEGFAAAGEVLTATAERSGPLDAVLVALSGVDAAAGDADGWKEVLAAHAPIPAAIGADAAWARATADYAASSDRPVRLVTLTDATNEGGRSRAQASAQLSRSAGSATKGRVAAFAVSLEGGNAAMTAPSRQFLGELVAHLIGEEETLALCGAELAVGDGWFGLRSHPRPLGSISFGGPHLPSWFDTVLGDLVADPPGPVPGDDPLKEGS
jgi:NAD(P)-dependent dehydrogenase (short-subunit alcohol dehydrogenase family)